MGNKTSKSSKPTKPSNVSTNSTQKVIKEPQNDKVIEAEFDEDAFNDYEYDINIYDKHYHMKTGNQPGVIIDNGSSSMKVGFVGDNMPTSIFPSIIGRPRQTGVAMMGTMESFVGNEALAKRAILSLKYPIENGNIINWDDIERIWHHAFYNELRVAPEEQEVFMTHSPNMSAANHQKMCQIMMETFNVTGYFTSAKTVLSLYAAGLTTGVVLQSGYSNSYIQPISEGYALAKYTKRLDIGGNHITNCLRELLNINSKHVPIQLVNDIKEKVCYVQTDNDKHAKSDENNIEYELPDGEIITIRNELRYECTELLFDSDKGIQKLLYDSVMECDVNIRNELFGNIVFSGGNSLFNGCSERVLNELNMISSNDTLTNGYLRQYYKSNNNEMVLCKDIVNLMNKYSSKYCVVEHKDENIARYSAWVGASILASLSTFEDMWILHTEYDSSGPAIVHRKCF